MAPLPQDLTARLFVDYVTRPSGGIEHTIQVRYVGPADNGFTAQVALADVLFALTPASFYAGWSVLRARYAPAGVNFTVPVPLASALSSFVGSDASPVTAQNEAAELVFVGRSPTTGRRSRLSFYGTSILNESFPGDFRIDAGNAGYGLIEDAIGVLNGSPGEGTSFRSIDGSPVVWYEYANANYNSYWERRIRKGA